MAISPIVDWRAESPSSSSFFLAKSSCSTLFNGYIMLYQVIFYVWLFCKPMISQCLLLKSVSWSKLFQVSNDQWLNQALGLFWLQNQTTSSKVEFPVQFFVNLAPLVVALHSGFIFSAVVFPCSRAPHTGRQGVQKSSSAGFAMIGSTKAWRGWVSPVMFVGLEAYPVM